MVGLREKPALVQSFVTASLKGWETTRQNPEEAVEIFREIGNRVGEAIGLLHLAEIGMYTGDDAVAKQHVVDALSIACDIKNMEIESECERLPTRYGPQPCCSVP